MKGFEIRRRKQSARCPGGRVTHGPGPCVAGTFTYPPGYELGLRGGPNHVAELCHRRRALRARLGLIDPATEADRHLAPREQVPIIDQEGRRAMEPKPFCIVW